MWYLVLGSATLTQTKRGQARSFEAVGSQAGTWGRTRNCDYASQVGCIGQRESIPFKWPLKIGAIRDGPQI